MADMVDPGYTPPASEQPDAGTPDGVGVQPPARRELDELELFPYPAREAAKMMARRQTELLAFVAFIVVALVSLGISPYTAVSTAFAAGLAAIELLRRAASKNDGK